MASTVSIYTVINARTQSGCTPPAHVHPRFAPTLIQAIPSLHGPLRQPTIWSPCFQARPSPTQPAPINQSNLFKIRNSPCHNSLHFSPTSSQTIHFPAPSSPGLPFCLTLWAFPSPGLFSLSLSHYSSPALSIAGSCSPSGFISKSSLQIVLPWPPHGSSQLTLSYHPVYFFFLAMMWMICYLSIYF